MLTPVQQDCFCLEVIVLNKFQYWSFIGDEIYIFIICWGLDEIYSCPGKCCLVHKKFQSCFQLNMGKKSPLEVDLCSRVTNYNITSNLHLLNSVRINFLLFFVFKLAGNFVIIMNDFDFSISRMFQF